MEVDDSDDGPSASHTHEQGFCCSARNCKWASVTSTSFSMHCRGSHRHDEPRPTRLSTWVIPLNPNGVRKRYRACCSFQQQQQQQQQHDTDGSDPNNPGGKQTGAQVDTGELQPRRKRQKTSNVVSEQQRAQQLGICVFGDSQMMKMMGGSYFNHVGPADPSNSRGLSPFYRGMKWFTENDKLTEGTIYEKQRNLLFYLTQSPRKGIKQIIA